MFVSIDTTAYFGGFYFNSLQNFVFDYVDNNRSQFKNWAFDNFKTEFDKDEVQVYCDLCT